MNKTMIALATLFLVSAASAPAIDLPYCGQTGTTGQKAGQRKGKKLGSQDGSGPIHEPGTGGGTGAGQRRGRK